MSESFSAPQPGGVPSPDPGAPPGPPPGPPEGGGTDRVRWIALALGILGLLALGLGVASYLSSGEDRDAADEASAEAASVAEEADAIESRADAATEAAESLPALAEELRAQVLALPDAFDDTVAEVNAVLACVNTAGGTVEGIRPCLADLQALEAAASSERAGLDEVRATLEEVRAALDAAETTEDGNDGEEADG